MTWGFFFLKKILKLGVGQVRKNITLKLIKIQDEDSLNFEIPRRMIYGYRKMS